MPSIGCTGSDGRLSDANIRSWRASADSARDERDDRTQPIGRPYPSVALSSAAPCTRRCRAVPRGRGAGGLLQQVFCFIEFGAVGGVFAEFLVEESLLHVAGFGESLRRNREQTLPFDCAQDEPHEKRCGNTKPREPAGRQRYNCGSKGCRPEGRRYRGKKRKEGPG